MQFREVLQKQKSLISVKVMKCGKNQDKMSDACKEIFISYCIIRFEEKPKEIKEK